MEWLENNTEDVFYIALSTFLTDRGIAFADITSATLMIKRTRGDLDSAAITSKTIGDGITKVDASESLQIKFSATDFGTDKLEAGRIYYMGLSIQTSAMSTPLELELVEGDVLTINRSFFNS